MTRLTFSMRRRWRNHTGNQGINPLRICEPTTLEEIVELVRDAERRAAPEGRGLRALVVGCRAHAGFLVQPTGLAKPLELEQELVRGDRVGGPLVHAQSSMRIRELNSHLDLLGLALPNMGGYDGQTIAGVISTSTHGSGLSSGPLPDLVRSLEIVGSGGRIYRIEPEDRPTDAAAYRERYSRRALVQDNDAFNAVVVGMGCMGVIYAVMLEVQPKFYLREVQTTSTWEKVSEQLRSGEVLRENRQCEVLFNPYERHGVHHCLITTRNEVSAEQYEHEPHHARHFGGRVLVLAFDHSRRDQSDRRNLATAVAVPDRSSDVRPRRQRLHQRQLPGAEQRCRQPAAGLFVRDRNTDRRPRAAHWSGAAHL